MAAENGPTTRWSFRVRANARARRARAEWSPPFLMADNKDLPDQNPVLFLDPRGTLWLFWVSSLDNSVRSYLLQYRTPTHYEADGPPTWDWQDVIICRPQDARARVPRGQLAPLLGAALDKGRRSERAQGPQRSRGQNTGDGPSRETAEDKLFQRLGWMTRQPPIMLSDTRMPARKPWARVMLGLYSDVFDCSLIVFTDDWGQTWHFSRPMILSSLRTIQPALVRKADGGITAFMRAAVHIRRADSADGGMMWKEAPMDIPNPGSSVSCVGLENGHWVLVCNDAMIGRNSLTVYLSDDEGETWKWRRPLERLETEGSASYPTVVQAADDAIHCTYSYKNPAEFQGSTIKHVRFNEAWVRAAGS